MAWKLAEAKNKFSELINKAISEGPQVVQRRRDVVVVLSEAEYHQLTKQRMGFNDFLLHSKPSFKDLILDRDKSPVRDVDL